MTDHATESYEDDGVLEVNGLKSLRMDETVALDSVILESGEGFRIAVELRHAMR